MSSNVNSSCRLQAPVDATVKVFDNEPYQKAAFLIGLGLYTSLLIWQHH